MWLKVRGFKYCWNLYPLTPETLSPSRSLWTLGTSTGPHRAPLSKLDLSGGWEQKAAEMLRALCCMESTCRIQERQRTGGDKQVPSHRAGGSQGPRRPLLCCSPPLAKTLELVLWAGPWIGFEDDGTQNLVPILKALCVWIHIKAHWKIVRIKYNCDCWQTQDQVFGSGYKLCPWRPRKEIILQCCGIILLFTVKMCFSRR